MDPVKKPKRAPLAPKTTNTKVTEPPAKRQNALPFIDDLNRHPGMPPIKNDRPIDLREQCNYLSNLADIVVSQAESCKQGMVACERFRHKLSKICESVVNEAARDENETISGLETSLLCFGSLRSGIALRDSDMDLLLKVVSSQEVNLIDKLGIPRRLQKALLLHGYGARLVTNTRVPILRVCSEPREELLNALLRELRESEAEQAGLPGSCTDAQAVRLFNTAIKDGWYNDADKKIIKGFEEAVWSSKGNTKDPTLCSARAQLKRLPRVIERYTGRRTMHDVSFPPPETGVQCDINFSGELARHNTQLVRCYMRCDDRLRNMTVFVKAWAKHREINKPYHGTLGSYGYVLMVLHFAVNIANPPLCPNLQQQLSGLRGGAGHVPRKCQGYNIQFWRDEKQVELAASRGMLTYNQQTIGALLRGFFAYYAGMQRESKTFNWAEDVLSLRSLHGLLSKKAKKWTAARTEIIPGNEPNHPSREVRHRYLFAIEDPFEIDHNVARNVTHFGLCAIKDEFRRAHRLIQHGGLMGDMAIDLMEKGESKEIVYPGLREANRIRDHWPESASKDSAKRTGREFAPPARQTQPPTQSKPAAEATAASKMDGKKAIS